MRGTRVRNRFWTPSVDQKSTINTGNWRDYCGPPWTNNQESEPHSKQTFHIGGPVRFHDAFFPFFFFSRSNNQNRPYFRCPSYICLLYWYTAERWLRAVARSFLAALVFPVFFQNGKVSKSPNSSCNMIVVLRSGVTYWYTAGSCSTSPLKTKTKTKKLPCCILYRDLYVLL